MYNHKLSSSKVNEKLLNFLSNSKRKTVLFELRLYCLFNEDGTIRWAIPSGSKSPLFLKTYNPINLRAFLIYKVLLLIHFLGLYRVFFKEIFLKVYEQSILSEYLINNNILDWSLFFGTAGDNRKIIMILKKKSGVSFVKIGLNQSSIESIVNEKNALLYLSSHNIKVPTILSYNLDYNCLELNDFGGRMIVRHNNFSLPHFNFMCELHSISESKMNLKDSEFYLKIQRRISFLTTLDLKKTNLEIWIIDLLQNVKMNFDKLSCLTDLSFGPSHGDFTSWNVFFYGVNPEIRCLDWEFFDTEAPKFYDFFHFNFQSRFLNSSSKSDYKKFLYNLFIQITEDFNYSINYTAFISYFNLYLLDIVSKNLAMYCQSDENLHKEAKSLLLAWSYFLNENIN